MGISRENRYGAAAFAVALCFAGRGGALEEPSAGTETQEPKTLPQDSIFSSMKQSLNQDIDHDIVRGYFELGSPPNVHRYYCLVSTQTGRREPNGVLGDPDPRPDGTVRILHSAVSMYSCAKAEQQDMLITAGYVLTGRAAVSAAIPAPHTTASASTPSPGLATIANPPTSVAPRPHLSSEQIDIGGIKLGMSPDEVRAVLKSKKLLNYDESAETLSFLDAASGAVQPVPKGRFVNVIAAWTPPPSFPDGDTSQGDGETYEVMFTPVPGKERVMSIVHSVGYSPAHAVRETALESGLIKKFGGFGSDDLPESPTWRLQSGGDVEVGDPCNRRGVFGGLGGLKAKERENLALKRTLEDFKFEIDHCGIAIITEDHFTANGGALHEDRLVTRFTVSAYSPSMALDGAKAARQLIIASGGTAQTLDISRTAEPPTL